MHFCAASMAQHTISIGAPHRTTLLLALFRREVRNDESSRDPSIQRQQSGFGWLQCSRDPPRVSRRLGPLGRPLSRVMFTREVRHERNVHGEAHGHKASGEGADERRHQREGDEVIGEEGAQLSAHHRHEALAQHAAHLLETLAFREWGEHEVCRVGQGCPEARVGKRLDDHQLYVSHKGLVDALQLEEAEQRSIGPGGQVAVG
mmetsp:Transcript_6348/g.12701  ORF Transcript_6348/g.12701 Transcript_6348/m.12701 type:complete len:204 (-) Transcript_6348:400-1011(-)